MPARESCFQFIVSNSFIKMSLIVDRLDVHSCASPAMEIARSVSSKRVLRSLSFLSILMYSVSAMAVTCAQLDGPDTPEIVSKLIEDPQLQSMKATRHVEPLKKVYARIAEAAKIRPALVVCNRDKPGAFTYYTGQQGAIEFTTPMLDLLDDNADEIAAVMAHEFSHLLLQHSARKLAARSIVASRARAVAINNYQRNGNVGRAIQSAKIFGTLELLSFSREVEREADDKGFSLAVTLAKFDGEGFVRIAKKFNEFPPSNRPPYLDTHPGWVERLEKADLRTLNQHYLVSAQTHFADKKWDALNTLVADWLSKIPSSGAAWYYKARLLARTSKSASDISIAYENAVSRYTNNPVLGVLSQADQAESADVWTNLCRALRAEGYALESANCALRIANKDERDRFILEAFDGMLFMDGKQPSVGNLLVAREPNSSKLFTNHQPTAASRGAYGPIPPGWMAIR